MCHVRDSVASSEARRGPRSGAIIRAMVLGTFAISKVPRRRGAKAPSFCAAKSLHSHSSTSVLRTYAQSERIYSGPSSYSESSAYSHPHADHSQKSLPRFRDFCLPSYACGLRNPCFDHKSSPYIPVRAFAAMLLTLLRLKVQGCHSWQPAHRFTIRPWRSRRNHGYRSSISTK